MGEETLPGQAGNEVDLTDLISQVVEQNYPNEGLDASKEIEAALRRDIQTFFQKAGLALVNSKGKRVEMHDIGVIKLKYRKPRKFKGFGLEAVETPARHKITFNAAPQYADLVGEALGTPVY